MRFSCILMVILVAACMCAAAAVSETDFPHGSISGVVTDFESGKPIPGAKVEVTKEGFSLGISTETDRDGRYVLDGVPAGVFDLTVSGESYLTKTVADIEVKDGVIAADTGIALNLITPIKPGDESRNFSLVSTEGRMVSLEDFKGKSVVVLSISSPYG